MNEPTAQVQPAAAADWIDPFCPLLSDRIGVEPGDPPTPRHPGAARTARALAHFPKQASGDAGVALVDGVPASLEDAVSAAARLIGGWRQPLFGGLGTDVAGARALTRLAMRCGAILDHAHGEAATQALRALQDRGGYTCTLSEIRNRADLLVCIGVDPLAYAPDFFERCGIGEAVPAAPDRQIVFVPGGPGPACAAALQGLPGVRVQTLDLHGDDLHVTLAELNAACYGRTLARGSGDWPALQGLAARLREARYAVLVYAPSQLPGAHSALLIETIGRVIKTLNRTTRAGALTLGGADGSASVAQAATWLTGLPPRTALYARGFEHDPHRFGTQRMLASGAADGLLWVSSFSPDLLPPRGTGTSPPLVLLGHPSMAVRYSGGRAGDSNDDPTPAVFIAVSTPGVNAPGHLFRADGGIVLALKPFTTTSLPGVDVIAQRLLARLESGRGSATGARP